jgi:hypothetical protein
MKRSIERGHRIDPAKMGKYWNHNGPNVSVVLPKQQRIANLFAEI